MNKKLKTVFIVVVVAGIAVLGVLFLGKNSPQTQTATLTTSADIPLPGNTTGNTTNADEFSSLLSSINTITIDTSFFKNPAYTLLRDYPVTLGTDVVGRVNPFAPVGSDPSVAAPQNAVSIQTLQPGKITSTSAELGAQLAVGDTTPTMVVFEYGTTDTFGSVTSPVAATKSGTTLVTISKLTPDTTYFVRAIAVRGAETTTAQTMSFITSKASKR